MYRTDQLYVIIANKMRVALAFVCLVNYVVGNNELLVNTPLGKIKGYHKVSFHGRQYRAFEGVPYALPPIGELRFQSPVPVINWLGTLSATRPQSVCLQYSQLPTNSAEKVEGTEDCLYLNIYIPSVEEEMKKLPVIFYIHGGAFQFGNGYFTGPDYLMDRDVVLVNFNYRLGPFGFLSTGDSVVPGNMGLKDQNLALKWVSKNIQYFGGDPTRITLAGLSAGGASVHYHYLSPLSRGLFHGGISFSGTALDCWTQAKNSAEKAKKLADIVGCPTSNSTELIKCLRTRPGYTIAQAVGNFMPWLYNPYTPFGPVVEVDSIEPFIDRSPVKIISSGDVADVPWITSLTSEEGLYPAAEFIADQQLMKQLDENWNKIAPHLLDFNFTIPATQHIQLADKIRHHYLQSRKIDRSNAKSLIHMVGDRLFAVGGEKAARMMAKANRSPVWFYYYTYEGFPIYYYFISPHEKFGVSHGDDVLLVFRHLNQPSINNNNVLAMQNKLMDIWLSFVNDRIPDAGIYWKEVDPLSEALEYLHIAGPHDIQMAKNANFGEKQFWESINFNENNLNGVDKSRDEL